MQVDILFATALNGVIGNANGSAIFKQLSTETLLTLRNSIRTKYDAILVGANTILKDNPALLNPTGRNLRVVIDKRGNIPPNKKIFITKPNQTIVLICSKNISKKYITQLAQRDVRIIKINNPNNLATILSKLRALGIQKLLVEGGAKTIHLFLAQHTISYLHVVLFPLFLRGLTIKGTNSQFGISNFPRPLTIINHKILDKKFVYLKLKSNNRK